MAFGKRIKALRESKALSQKELGEIVHVSPNSISAYERGVKNPPIHVLIGLAQFFNVSVDYILDLTDAKTPSNFSQSYLTTRDGNVPLSILTDLKDDELELFGLFLKAFGKYNHDIPKTKTKK